MNNNFITTCRSSDRWCQRALEGHHLRRVQGLLPIPEQPGRLRDRDEDVHVGRQGHRAGGVFPGCRHLHRKAAFASCRPHRVSGLNHFFWLYQQNDPAL